ncbi:EamA/RhaT family transporter, partial [Streptomyces sp. NPDC001139]
YFIPVIATGAGVAILGESLRWSTPVGAAPSSYDAGYSPSRRRTRSWPTARSSVGRRGPVSRPTSRW